MTLLDDDIDDLLQSFRADEARLDDATRARIWARVCESAPEAPTELDTLDRLARVRRLRRRATGARPRGRLLGVAAAVLVLVAVAALAVRSGPSDDAVTAGPPTTVPLPRDLWELADAVTDLPVTQLGSSPDAAYAYRRGVRTIQAQPDDEPTWRIEKVWVASDGTGRLISGGDRDDVLDEPGSLALGPFAPAVAVDLPDEADVVIAQAERELPTAVDAEVSPGLIDSLTYAGLPGRARAGLLRALATLDFVIVPTPDLAPTVMRVEGLGPDGSTMQADLDLLTGRAIATARLSGGGSERLTISEVDLRRDREGS